MPDDDGSIPMDDVALYRCLGDPRRLAALKELAKAPACFGTDLAGPAGARDAELSRHLASLCACGLVEARREGSRVCYRVASPRLATILEMAERFSAHVRCADPEACASEGCC